MRLIDIDAFRKEHRMNEHCEDCERNARECQYNDFSMMDFCGWLDDAPTVDTVPLDKLCEWLQDNAALTHGAHISAYGWKRELTVWMEEQDAKKET